MKLTMRLVFGTALVLVIALGVAALIATPAEAARCICPQVYAPVQCDHGKVYPNQCVADCHHAKNCVPTGII